MAERVLFVHAHRDDTADAVATMIDHGSSVSVLTCTRGETGEEQLENQLQALGVADQRYLGSEGARWEGLAQRRYDVGALLAAEAGEVAADVAARIMDARPDVVVTHDATGADEHPEFERVLHATRTATSVLGTPLYVIGGAAPELTFQRERPASSSFSDYGIAARIVTCVLALVLGAFVGATLTVAHQAAVTVLGVRVPWGIIAGLVITTALFVGLRMVFETRIVAGFAALGLLGASAFLAVQSSGGSILVPDNIAGYVWTFGPVIIAGIVLAWPQVRRPAGSNIGETSLKGSVSP